MCGIELDQLYSENKKEICENGVIIDRPVKRLISFLSEYVRLFWTQKNLIYGKFFTWSLETTYGAGQRNSISIFQMEKLRLKDKWLP